MPIRLGSQVSQSSHNPMQFWGLIYCDRCGARAGENQIRYSAKPCEPPTLTGRRTLMYIDNGPEYSYFYCRISAPRTVSEHGATTRKKHPEATPTIPVVGN